MRGLKGMNTEVVVYKGEDVIAMGTVRECAKKLGVLPGTIYFYLMPSYEARIERRKRSSGNIRRVVIV